MVENLRIAFWVYKKDESRKIRIETIVCVYVILASNIDKKDESRKIRIETLCAFVVELDSLFHKKDESRKIRIETPKTSKNCIFSPLIRKMNKDK